MVQTTYDIIKAHGGEIKVETKEARPPVPVRTGMIRLDGVKEVSL